MESLRNNHVSRDIHYKLQSQRFKYVDCKLLFVFMEDLKRHKLMSKVKESNFIFVNRSANSPSQKAAVKAKYQKR
jgi:hypothetical protein